MPPVAQPRRRRNRRSAEPAHTLSKEKESSTSKKMMLSTLRRSTAPLRRSNVAAPLRRAEALSSLASMTPGGGVHGSQTSVNARRWRQKPLLRVYGEELYFKTGSDAVKLLSNEAERRDKDKPLYLAQFTNFMRHLQPVRISASRRVESRHQLVSISP